MDLKRSTYTRRHALQMLALAGGICLPARALADTQTELSGAQARLAEAQAELDAIATEYEALSTEQSKTLDQLDALRKQISGTEKKIERLQDKLEAKQDELARNVSEEYKDGNRGVVDLLLKSTSVENLISNFYYYNKVTEEQTALIHEVKDMRAEQVQHKTELELEQAELEQMRATQAEQLEAMRDKQYEAQQVIDGLDKEVKKLMAKREAELLAAQREAEEARRQREEQARREREEAEAAAASQEEVVQDNVSSDESARMPDTADDESVGTDGAEDSEPASSAETDDGVDLEPQVEPEPEPEPSGSTGSAAAVISACYNTPSPGLGLCAGWCSNVMINAGYGFVPGNANDMYANYCYSSDRADLRPGMAVAVSTHPHTSAGRIYGHIGMYIGNGMMMDNVGFIRTISVDEWVAFYAQTVPARWGWLKGIVLA